MSTPAELKMISAKTRRQVALVYPLAVPWITTFVGGIMEYANQHGGWSLITSPPSLIGAGEDPLRLDDLQGWSGDGAMAAILDKADIRAAQRLNIPVLNLSATLSNTVIPRVRPDHYGMGRRAAEHLLQRGLTRLAYYGLKGFWFSQERCRGFTDCAKEAGATVDILEIPRKWGEWANLRKRTDMLVQWLKQLRPPIGILAVQDYRARSVIEECEHIGLQIPHDVAVIGMENDPTLCEFCQPTLSSVSRNSWQLGFKTAQMLDHLMEGLLIPMDTIVPSGNVVARKSTDTISVNDHHVADALHFIHDHISEPFGVDRVVRATSISRRLLEVRFRRTLGCTPNEYLNRKRVERVKALLDSAGKTKLHKLAAICGFSNAQQMRQVFKRVTGMTPLEYRQSKSKLDFRTKDETIENNRLPK